MGVGLEAVDRPTSASSFAAVSAAQPGSSSSAGAVAAGPLFELTLEFRDCAGERAAAGNQFACHAHLDVLLAPCEPTSDALEVRRPVESSRRHDEGRIELMQVPAQPLLRPTALVDKIIAVIDQQLQITKRLLIRPWACSFANRSACA